MKVGELPGWLGGGTLAWQQDLEMKMRWGKKGGQEERDGKRDRRSGEGEEREGDGKEGQKRKGGGEERYREEVGAGKEWVEEEEEERRGEKKSVGSKGKRGRKHKVPRKITKRARAPTPVSGLQKAREHACHSEVALEHIWTAVFRGG